MWDKLSIRDKAELIRLGVRNNITNIDAIKKGYNNYAYGGETENPNEVVQPIVFNGSDDVSVELPQVNGYIQDYDVNTGKHNYVPILNESIGPDDVKIGVGTYQRPDGSTYFRNEEIPQIKNEYLRDEDGEIYRTPSGKTFVGNDSEELAAKKRRWMLDNTDEALKEGDRMLTERYGTDWRVKTGWSTDEAFKEMGRWAPIMGDVMDAYDVYDAFKNKDYTTGLASLALLALPEVAETGIKGASRLFNKVNNNVIEKTIQNADDLSQYDVYPTPDIKVEEAAVNTWPLFLNREHNIYRPNNAISRRAYQNTGLPKVKRSDVTFSNREGKIMDTPILDVLGDHVEESLGQVYQFMRDYNDIRVRQFIKELGIDPIYYSHYGNGKGIPAPIFDSDMFFTSPSSIEINHYNPKKDEAGFFSPKDKSILLTDHGLEYNIFNTPGFKNTPEHIKKIITEINNRGLFKQYVEDYLSPTLVHEWRHAQQDFLPWISPTKIEDGYYALNREHPLSPIFDLNVSNHPERTPWHNSPDEITAEIAKESWELANPSLFHDLSTGEQSEMLDFISDRFYLPKENALGILKGTAKYGLAEGGYLSNNRGSSKKN